MAIPPEPVLRAAVRWLEKLPVSGQARTRALFTTVGEYSDLTPTQYDAGLAWLREVGLLDSACSSPPAFFRVFDAVVEHSQASWLPDADMLIRSSEELPADLLAVAHALGFDGRTAFSRLSAVWGKVDADQRLRIGNAGELAIIELLTEASASIEVDHVASWSDWFGYDIAVSHSDGDMHLEVKTTMRRGRVSFYLSRNEYRVMQDDATWSLIVVRIDSRLEPQAIGTVSKEWIAAHVPSDRSLLGTWQSCRLDVPPHALVPGIPTGLPLGSGRAASFLRGLEGWPG
ncbi:protein NO VEIN domain-containing protein [Nocardia sp. NPDC020380]|uniref:protein NO VEIN domain-containing protein n=1 Tax=Nocardia sp. NPDC020380 TaxID=3364309 RepID=UPI0037B1FC95